MVTPTQMAHYEEAVKHYSRAVEMRPNFALSYIYRGDIYRKMGKFDLAIDDYTEAIFWTRQPANAYHGRGMAYGAKGEFDKAIEDFTRAIQYEQDYAEAYYHRAHAYVSKKEFDRAIEDCDKAIRLNPDVAGLKPISFEATLIATKANLTSLLWTIVKRYDSSRILLRSTLFVAMLTAARVKVIKLLQTIAGR